MVSERLAGLHRCSFHGHEMWEQMRQNMKAERAKSHQLLVSSVKYTHLSDSSISVKLKWAAWDQYCTEKNEADKGEIQCSHQAENESVAFPMSCSSIWHKDGGVCFGLNDLNVHCRICAIRTWPGWVPEVSVGRSKSSFKLRQGGERSPPWQPPDASAIKRQGKGRRWLLHCRSVSGMPHMLKTLASVQLELFLPRKIERLQRLLCMRLFTDYKKTRKW